MPASANQEALDLAKYLHPMRCRNKLFLNRGMRFVDTLNYAEDGVFLVGIGWDEHETDNTSKSLAELADLGKAAETGDQRVAYNSHAHAINLSKAIKFGRRPCAHNHRNFLDYKGPLNRSHSGGYLHAG